MKPPLDATDLRYYLETDPLKPPLLVGTINYFDDLLSDQACDITPSSFLASLPCAAFLLVIGDGLTGSDGGSLLLLEEKDLERPSGTVCSPALDPDAVLAYWPSKPPGQRKTICTLYRPPNGVNLSYLYHKDFAKKIIASDERVNFNGAAKEQMTLRSNGECILTRDRNTQCAHLIPAVRGNIAKTISRERGGRGEALTEAIYGVLLGCTGAPSLHAAFSGKDLALMPLPNAWVDRSGQPQGFTKISPVAIPTTFLQLKLSSGRQTAALIELAPPVCCSTARTTWNWTDADRCPPQQWTWTYAFASSVAGGIFARGEPEPASAATVRAFLRSRNTTMLMSEREEEDRTSVASGDWSEGRKAKEQERAGLVAQEDLVLLGSQDSLPISLPARPSALPLPTSPETSSTLSTFPSPDFSPRQLSLNPLHHLSPVSQHRPPEADDDPADSDLPARPAEARTRSYAAAATPSALQQPQASHTSSNGSEKRQVYLEVNQVQTLGWADTGQVLRKWLKSSSTAP